MCILFLLLLLVSQVATTALMEETGYSSYICQLALKECCNFVDMARSYLTSHIDDLRRAEEEYLRIRAIADDSETMAPGLYQDSMGYIQVNTQTCEIYINNRTSLPVPIEISDHRDFKEVFKELSSLYCTVSSLDSNRSVIQIVDPQGIFGIYEIQSWMPLKPYGSKGDGRGAILQEEGEQIVDDGRCTAFNLPIIQGSFEFDGSNFVIYNRGDCGWMSEIFDAMNLFEDDDIEAIFCSEASAQFASFSSLSSSEEKSARGTILLRAHCSPTNRGRYNIDKSIHVHIN